MTIPTGILGLALLFWGWQTGLPAPALVLALAVEAPALVRARWPLDTRDFHRVADFTAALFVLGVVYFLLTPATLQPIYAILLWLPLTYAPLTLAQSYSSAGRLPLSALFHSLRGAGRADESLPQHIDFRLFHFALCLLAAGIMPAVPWVYFGGCAVLLGLVLGIRRAARPGPAWAGALAAAVGLGLAVLAGILHLQGWVTDRLPDWLARLSADPYRYETAIGDLGRLKQSDRIVFHLRSDAPLPGGLLLMEASYDVYRGRSWQVSDRRFEPVDQNAPPPALPQQRRLTIYRGFPDRQAVLALPLGVLRLEGLEGAELARNRYGAYKVSGAPAYAGFGAYYQPALADFPHGDRDRFVPARLRATLEGIALQLHLSEQTPAQRIASLRAWFRERFRYTLYQPQSHPAADAIDEFLRQRRAGHCEYFAAATTLLLRQAGIPARLAIGYAVREYDPHDRLYVVRQRHGHAWTLAWLEDRWVEVDTTPAQWFAMEERAAAAWYRPAADRLARWWNRFRRWRWERSQTHQRSDRRLLLGGIGAVALYLGLRIWLGRRRGIGAGVDRSRHADSPPLPPSPYAAVERSLAARHGPRPPGLTPRAWLLGIGAGDALPLLELHYRLRFDPRGLTPAEQEALARAVSAWLRLRTPEDPRRPPSSRRSGSPADTASTRRRWP